MATTAAPTRAQLVQTILVGLGAGFLSGLFGVGGGILIVPALVLVLGMSQRLAHGTSLAAVLPIAMSGVVGYALDDSVDWPVALGLTIGAIGGAMIGTYALQKLSTKVLARAFSAVLLLSAARLVFETAEGGGRADLSPLMVVALVVIGVLSGTLAGMLGVGGGVIMVPAMILLLGMPAVIAKGTSLAVIIPTSVVATRRNLRNNNADLRTAAAVGITGVVSAYGASQISVGLDERVSNVLFAALLAFVAIRMFIASFSNR